MSIRTEMANLAIHFANVGIGISEMPISVTDKIKSFADLDDGWDYGAGAPIPERRIRAAITWNRLLDIFGFSNMDASPGADGEISIAGSCGDHYLEVIVEADDVSASVAYDFKGKQQFYRLKMPTIEALGTALDLVGGIWSASTWYTQGNITQPRISGFELLSERTRAHYPFFPASVFETQEFRYVSTRGNTMESLNLYAANPQCTGLLIQSGCLREGPSLWMARGNAAIISSKD
jgi:hypothetical protein